LQPPVVQQAGVDRRKAVSRIMGLGFVTDPVSRWVWPDPSTFFENFPKFATAIGGTAFDHDSAFETQCQRAAANWLPPGAESDADSIGEIVATSIPAERLEEVGAFFEQVNGFHPEEPHWYLPMIAVDPAHTGQGLGNALMKHALDIIDAAHLPAYLESSNPRNISLYERHGFEVIGQIQTDSSPVMTPMYRIAQN